MYDVNVQRYCAEYIDAFYKNNGMQNKSLRALRRDGALIKTTVAGLASFLVFAAFLLQPEA